MIFNLLLATALGFGVMPGMQSPFKQLPNANNPRAQFAFTDGMDSKESLMFIAAGMYPRYMPLLTDGVDSADMWMYGFTGMTEAQVIARAKAQFPMSAMLGRPENQELNPDWAKVVAAGMTHVPTETVAVSNGTSTGTDSGIVTNPATGLPGAGLPMIPFGETEFEAPEMPEMEGGMAAAMAMAGAGGAATSAGVTPVAPVAPMMPGMMGLEEIGDVESNAAWHAATGCNLLGAQEEGQACAMQLTEVACGQCAALGCTWSGVGCMGGFPMLRKNAPAAQTQPEEPKWTDTVDPVYTLLFGVLAGAVFGCGLGMIYSRCTSKRNSFEESMIRLDAQV